MIPSTIWGVVAWIVVGCIFSGLAGFLLEAGLGVPREKRGDVALGAIFAWESLMVAVLAALGLLRL